MRFDLLPPKDIQLPANFSRPIHRLIRIAAYVWASPYTLSGIAIGLVLGGRFQTVDGVVEISGSRIQGALNRFPQPAMAMTLGHVVFGQTKSDLSVSRLHERVHVRQYERWGPAFVPVYLAASLYLFLLGRDWYRGNPFEIEAYAVDDPSRRRARPEPSRRTGRE